MTGTLPSGTLTYLFTDVEASIELWEQEPDSMQGALARHDALIEAGGSDTRPPTELIVNVRGPNEIVVAYRTAVEEGPVCVADKLNGHLTGSRRS